MSSSRLGRAAVGGHGGGGGGGGFGPQKGGELFSGSARKALEEAKEGGTSPTPRDQYEDVGTAEDDPLQLEHILGYAGDYRNTVLALPGNENLYVKR